MKLGQQAVFFDGGGAKELCAAIERLRGAGARSLMIFACEADHWPSQDLNPLLRSLDMPVFGGVFPSIIHNAQLHRTGTVVVGFPQLLEVAVVSGLGDRQTIEPQLQRLAPVLERAGSVLGLVDGLSANLETLVECLYGILGVRTPMIGGGAGHLDLVQRPCLLTNQGMLEDSAVLVSLPMRIDRGIAHGWQMLSGPFLVTKSAGNVLEELNYRPAYEIYRNEIEANSAEDFAKKDFFSISKTYPLGIEGIEGEFLVRDPIKREGDALICVGEVPENATIHLLKGDSASLVSAAGGAARAALAERQSRTAEDSIEPTMALICDCISRFLFLGKAFDEELGTIKQALPGIECMVGALTIGEIASSRRGMIELMNKSTLVALI